MFQEIDGKRVQQLAALEPRELCGEFAGEVSKEHLVALLRQFGTALLERDRETMKALRRGFRELNRDELSESAEFAAEAMLDAVDFGVSHWLRTRPDPLAAIDLTAGDRKILGYLAEHPQTASGDLAEALGRPPQSVSTSLTTLRDHDPPLVKYRKSRRRHEYSLTETGRRLVYRESFPEWVGECVAVASAMLEDIDEFVRMMEHVDEHPDYRDSWIAKVVEDEVEPPNEVYHEVVERLLPRLHKKFAARQRSESRKQIGWREELRSSKGGDEKVTYDSLREVPTG